MHALILSINFKSGFVIYLSWCVGLKVTEAFVTLFQQKMEDTRKLAELSPSISTRLADLRREKVELQSQLFSLGFGIPLRHEEPATGVASGVSVLASAQKRSRISNEGNSNFNNDSSNSAKRRK